LKFAVLIGRKSAFLSFLFGMFSASAVQIVTLGTDNRLRTIDSASPPTVLQTLTISGLFPGEVLLGVDWRPSTGQLYALGNSNRLYAISHSGVASLVGAGGGFTLSGAAFGFNFNPIADRIRVVSDAEQNIRLNPIDGTLSVADAALSYAAGDPHAGANPGVVACAYINSFAGAGLTTLYGIDSALDILVVQNPPNNGTLNTVGPLGVNAGTITGFDVWDFTNQAFAALAPPAAVASSLYTIDLATGAATLHGTIGGGVLVRALAVLPAGSLRFSSTNYVSTEQNGSATITVTRVGGTNGSMTVSYSTSPGTALAGNDYGAVSGSLTFTNGQTVNTFQVPVDADGLPEFTESFTVSLTAAPGAALLGAPVNAAVQISSTELLPMYFVTLSNRLLRISTNATVFDRTNNITGLQSNEKILGIDFRPALGQLYALGSSNRLYIINETSGVATVVGVAGAFTLSGAEFGFDFNPTVDRIRIVSDIHQNMRLNPNDGSLVANDGALSYAAGDPNQGVNPIVFASGYTRSFAGAITTTLYGIDATADVLVTQNPPNNGTLNTVGALGIDVTSTGGFDILATGNAAFAVMTRTGATNSELYSINLVTGAAQSLGVMAAPEQIRGLAIPDPPPTLAIGRAGTNVLLSWPAASFGYTLENTTSLVPASWSSNASLPVVLNDRKVVTNAPAPATRFYRLKK
jgi:hypothetical protein